MKLASLKDGRDGRLVVVSHDLSRYLPAGDIADTLQDALDNWDTCKPKLEAIAEKLASVYRSPLQKLDVCRLELFLDLDKPALKPLPTHRYEYAEFRKARVNIDYHVVFEKHYYSVPFALVHEAVEILAKMAAAQSDTIAAIAARRKPRQKPL